MKELPQSSYLEKAYNLNPNLEAAFFNKSWAIDYLEELSLRTLLLQYPSWTYEHSIRTGYISNELSKETFFIGVMHDIGKLGVPSKILDLPSSQLQPFERKILDTHPRIGFDQVQPFDPNLASIVVAHHEHQYRKYPRKIPRNIDPALYEKILVVALADATDALMSNRPYKEGWPSDKTLYYLKDYFDENQVKLAIKAFGEIY